MFSSSDILALAGLTAGAVLLSSPVATAQSAAVTTTRIASGLSQPLFVTHAPNDSTRLFIVEQGTSTSASVKIYDVASHTVLGTPFITVTGIIAGGEQGLLGLAFDPNYATNGFFYLYYSFPGGGAAGQERVVRYTRSAGNPSTADVSTAQLILTENDPFSNHNGGWIGFGPDGYLYVAMGDGGSGNDPNGNAQNLGIRWGKMLRIDVSADGFPTDANRFYTIPPGNPFVGTAGALPEIWFYGLRNPWRDSFDRLTGEMWIGDVGQGAVEEVDHVNAGVGGLNFGWRCMEGTSCTGLSGCTCNSPTLTLPVQTYTHSFGCSITGGYRYRGTALCGWQGTYFYADYCSATIWSFGFNGTSITDFTNRTSQLAPGGGLSIASITSFGEDNDGELYIVDQGGEVFKIIPRPNFPDCNSNGIDDGCDILNGTSRDANHDGIPDECQPTSTPYCFGTGGTPCPCGNSGSAGNGCANSVSANGANLGSAGQSTLANDDFVLVGSGMPNNTALYFQGTTQINGGQGSPFGDGLRCAGGTVMRLAVKTNSSGASQYPEILDPSISQRGGITTAPTTRTYQVWYRDSSTTFCMPDTFNLTNALNVHWVP